MNHRIMKSLAVAAILSMGIAACGSSGSGSNSSTPTVKQGKTLVIESTPLSPMTDTFNPFSLTSTGYLTNSVSLYNEPLYIWNTLNPTQAPIPFLASGPPSWSNGGKTLTLPIRSGVKWNDGKAFSASDVAFTFTMLSKNPKLNTSGAPVVTSATATSPTSATLNFAAPQYANMFSIGQVYIVPQHVWQSVSDPATFADPNPVGTGPYMLDKFSPQGYTLKANPNYWQKSKVHVPEIDFPSYNTNANLVPPIANGQIDWADNYTGAQLIVRQLNAMGFDASVDGIGNPTVWAGDVANGTFDATIHWSNQGPNPYFFYSNWLDKSLSAPIGKPAAGDFGRFSNAQAQAALAQFASTGDSTTQAQAITKLENVMSSQVPVVPLMYGGAWSEYSTRNYTGWPSASNPYMVPVPNIPYLEYTVLQLKPVG